MITVIVPAFNAAATLPEQLDGLAKQVIDEPWELLVVDNASTDDTAAIIDSYQTTMENLTLLQEPEKGVNRARNKGLDAAGGTKILFSDADDIVGPGWVKAMADGLENFDIVGGWLDRWVLDVDPPEHLDEQPISSIFGSEFLPYTLGCCSGIRRSVVEKVGPFDITMSYGGDEVEFFWRAQLAGFKLGQADPKALLTRRERPIDERLQKQSRIFGRSEMELARRFADRGYPTSFARRVPLRLARQSLRMLTNRHDRDTIQRFNFNLGALQGLIFDRKST